MSWTTYETLASDPRPVGYGPKHERVATAFQVATGHPTVLSELRMRPGRWILWINVDDFSFTDGEHYTGRQLQFVFMEDGISVIAECSSNVTLHKQRHLTPADEIALRTLGWHEADMVHTPHWWYEATADADMGPLGDLAERTLFDVFGLAARDRITVGFQRAYLEGELK